MQEAHERYKAVHNAKMREVIREKCQLEKENHELETYNWELEDCIVKLMSDSEEDERTGAAKTRTRRQSSLRSQHAKKKTRKQLRRKQVSKEEATSNYDRNRIERELREVESDELYDELREHPVYKGPHISDPM